MKLRDELLNKICDSLVNSPLDWSIRDLSYYNPSANIAIWKTDLRISHPIDIHLNFWEQRKLKKAVNTFKYKYLINGLDNPDMNKPNCG